jgi:hypothetical protein
MRSCGLSTRPVGSTDRLAGLLVGRTDLSGTAVSLVGGDPGVPMSHKPPSEVYVYRPYKGHDEVKELSTGRIACASVQKERETNQLSNHLFVVLPNEERSSDDL